ncbi:carbohydrate porin [Methylobacterium sp. Leaf106]|uniref:carbohydrate porin n=1 Tax=Methylobacterium sp. Leaf106 TaxID=1736255 RepID=UPI0006FDB408|nr:carbohydrate porin [Methylobacterium sp. Leaf106]KQP39467.1 porin [Methylobacterium sp. Leaf106]
MPRDATEKPASAAVARSARRTGLPVLLGGAFLAAGMLCAEAQTASPVGELNAQTQPRTDRDIASKPADPVRTGPLAPWATDMAARGLTFDVNIYDFYQANPSAGLRTGEQSNAAYFVLSMTADMQKLAGIAGGSINFTQTFFGLVRNLNMAGDIGDTTVGYQPPYTPNSTRLSLLTYQQKLLDDRLVVEVGRTHPDRYYGLPPCNSINSCFQDMFYFNAGFTSPLFGVWGANIAYKLSPTTYIQAGAFSVNPNTNVLSGYDFGYERLSGAVVMTEIGRKTDYTMEAYPGRVSLTGFYNTADHDDNFKTIAGTSKGLNPGTPSLQKSGTSGVVLTGTQTLWRADGGRDASNPHPTAISAYTGTGYAFDPTIPIRFNSFAGLLLQAPDQGRPNDTYGIKANWQRLNQNYADFLSDANFISGGTGEPYSRDKFVFEVNAHFDLGAGVVLEPVVQYVVNPNSFYNPYTARRAKDGFYGGFTLVVPLGTLLGLAPG